VGFWVVEYLDLNQNELLLATLAAGFVVGMLFIWLFSKPKSSVPSGEDPRNHQIRALEADMRTAKRQLSDLQVELEAKNEEFDTAVSTLQGLRAKLSASDGEREHFRDELKESVSKTRELRQELQDRATETIREHLRAEDAQTELEVTRAGSEAVMSEISRLQDEKVSMTNTMRKLELGDVEDLLISEEDILGDGQSGK
jgi:chromosome segregation ATPase